jgi:hypothetical protein
MRPSGVTPLASTQTIDAPPTARLPRCTKCQSLGMPFSLEYMHIGETKIRLWNSTSEGRGGRRGRGHRAIIMECNTPSPFARVNALPSAFARTASILPTSRSCRVPRADRRRWASRGSTGQCSASGCPRLPACVISSAHPLGRGGLPPLAATTRWPHSTNSRAGIPSRPIRSGRRAASSQTRRAKCSRDCSRDARTRSSATRTIVSTSSR